MSCKDYPFVGKDKEKNIAPSGTKFAKGSL